MSNFNARVVTDHIPEFMDSLYNAESLRNITVVELRDLFHTNQIKSKAWLIREFICGDYDKDSKILIIGSWTGFTTLCLQKLGYTNLTEIDLNPKYLKISQNLVQNVTRHFKDVNSFIEINDYDIIINMSCEHIVEDTWFKRIDHGKLLLLQSNNLEIPEHVNICKNIGEMVLKYPLKTLFSGTLNLNIYDRYMLVGRK